MNEVNETELTNNQQLIQFKLLLCCIVNFTICNYFTIAIHNHGLTLATHMERDPEVGLGIVWVQLSPKVTSRIHSPIYIMWQIKKPWTLNLEHHIMGTVFPVVLTSAAENVHLPVRGQNYLPWPGIKPGPWRWEHQILTTRPPGKGWLAGWLACCLPACGPFNKMNNSKIQFRPMAQYFWKHKTLRMES